MTGWFPYSISTGNEDNSGSEVQAKSSAMCMFSSHDDAVSKPRETKMQAEAGLLFGIWCAFKCNSNEHHDATIPSFLSREMWPYYLVVPAYFPKKPNSQKRNLFQKTNFSLKFPGLRLLRHLKILWFFPLLNSVWRWFAFCHNAVWKGHKGLIKSSFFLHMIIRNNTF